MSVVFSAMDCRMFLMHLVLHSSASCSCDDQCMRSLNSCCVLCILAENDAVLQFLQAGTKCSFSCNASRVHCLR